MNARKQTSVGHGRSWIGWALAAALAALTGSRVGAATITWSGGGDGTTWSSTSNWMGGILPGSGDDAVIPVLTGTPTITFSSAAGTVVIKSLTSSEPVNITGGSLQATNGITTSSTLSLSGGTIASTTLATTGAGALSAASGTLDGVTLASPITVNGTITIKDGLTVSGGSRLTLSAATLSFVGTQTLGGTGELYFGGSSTSVIQSIGGNSIATASILTIGANITIDGTQNGQVNGYYTQDGVINKGIINAGTTGQTITFNYGSLTNQGTIEVATGATMTVYNAWSNTGTIGINGGTFNLAGTGTAAGLGTITRTGGTFNLTAAIANTSATLTVTSAYGTVILGNGTITGGTIATSGTGAFIAAGGILDGVTLASPITVSGTVTVKDGLTLSGSPKVTMSGATLNFTGTQTLGGTGEIFFGGSSTSVIQSIGGNSSATASILTIASSITIDGTQNGQVNGYYQYDGVINAGIINAGTNGQTITFNYGSLTNQGTIEVATGATMTVYNAWTNTGTIGINGGTFNLAGTGTAAGIGTISRTGGTFNLSAAIANTSATLTVTSAYGTVILGNGTITGGTIATSGTGAFIAAGGTLDGVTVASPITVSGTVTIKDGLTLSGNPKVTMSGATLNFPGTQTLGGTGEIFFGGSSTSVIQSIGGNSIATASILTIGANITIDGTQNGQVNGYYPQDGVINAGVVNAGTNGQTITFNYGSLTNQGTIEVATGATMTLNNMWSNTGTIGITGGTLNLAGTGTSGGIGTISRTGGTLNLTGTLTNTGSTLALTAATGPLVLNGGTITGGTITTAGGATFTASSGTLDGVTIASPITVSGTITVKDGLTLSGGVRLSMSSGTMNLTGTQTIGGTGEIFFGPSAGNVIQTIGGNSIATASILTIGASVTIDGSQSGQVNGYYQYDGVINLGLINASSSGQTISFNNGTFTNQGNVEAGTGATIYFGNAWMNSATITINGGTVTFAGTGSGSAIGTIARTGGTINITGTLTDTGSTLALTAGTGSMILGGGTITGGTITTAGGATFTATSGTLDGVTVGSPVTVAGTITVKDGLTLSNTSMSINSGNLYFNGTQTLGGTGTVYLGSSSSSAYIESIGGGSLATASALTIGPNVSIVCTSGQISGYYTYDSVINEGSISEATSGDYLSFGAGIFTNQGTLTASNGGIVELEDAWSNTGTFNVNGGVIDMGGTFTASGVGTVGGTGGTVNLTGTLTNTGNTLTLTGTSVKWVLDGGSVVGGTIASSGGASLASTNGTLDGVTLSAPLNVTGNATIKDGLTLNGAKVTINGGRVYAQGTQTIGGTGEIYFGPTAGIIYSQGDGSSAGAATLTIAQTITMDGSSNPSVQSYYSYDQVQSFASVTFTAPRLVNISTRAVVGTGGNILIPGFVISGTGTETLLIRGDGPSLTAFGVAGALSQPTLTLSDSKGNTLATNTGWGTNANPSQITSIAAKVGAFPFASGSADCALIAVLPAGAYTVQISGVNNTTGVGLAEIYEVSSTGTRLVNISTRAQVGTGANIIIPGFVVQGSGSENLLVRGDGPALTGFGVTGVLAQPSITLFNSGGSVLASNTAWGTNANPSLITTDGSQVGAFPLTTGSADSALVTTLPSGAFTLQVSGVGSTTGDALAEVYEIP